MCVYMYVFASVDTCDESNLVYQSYLHLAKKYTRNL